MALYYLPFFPIIKYDKYLKIVKSGNEIGDQKNCWTALFDFAPMAVERTKRKIIFVVSLWLKSENISDFEAYERRAARLLAKHSGRIERAVRVKEPENNDGKPFEIHFVSFPNEQKFADYLADSETRELVGWRDKIIARTEIFSGYDISVYHE